ncbi:MAG: hypothetical protein IK999_08670 [Ruminococcus sp.]|nr:hypothetical protein [Ruminococcus sp.]
MMIRREAKESFTWVHNTFIRDKRLSLAERGMLLLLISLPDDWSFSIAGIKAMVQDGREKVSSTLKALEEHGYLRRVQRYNENGAFTDLLYTFSDEPIFLDEDHKPGEDDFMKVFGEHAEKADVMPMTENPHTAPTNTSNPSNINNYNNKLLIYESTTKEIMCCKAAQGSKGQEERIEEKPSKAVKTKKSVDAREKEFDPSRGDYIGGDGLWYCGKCHTPMQKRVEYFGEMRREYIPCKCRREETEAQRKRERRYANEMRLMNARELCFSNSVLWKYTFDNCDDPTDPLMVSMKKYCDNFDDLYRDGCGLVLYGSVGVGKTGSLRGAKLQALALQMNSSKSTARCI